MNFSNILERLREAVKGQRGRKDDCLVHKFDLAELLRDWERLDYEVRVLVPQLESIRSQLKACKWEYCPECGSEEIRHQEGDHKQCEVCHQEWFSDLYYTDTVKANLKNWMDDKAQLKAEKEKNSELLTQRIFDSSDMKLINDLGYPDLISLISATKAAQEEIIRIKTPKDDMYDVYETFYMDAHAWLRPHIESGKLPTSVIESMQEVIEFWAAEQEDK